MAIAAPGRRADRNEHGVGSTNSGEFGGEGQSEVLHIGGNEFGKAGFLDRRSYPDERRTQVADTATLLWNTHLVKFGFDFNRTADTLDNLFQESGVYNYNSRADFISKITTVLEESDESEFWLELTERAELLPPKRLADLNAEANELTRIFNATRTTAKSKAAKP